jgi:hypothetical protein
VKPDVSIKDSSRCGAVIEKHLAFCTAFGAEDLTMLLVAVASRLAGILGGMA